MKVSDIEKMTVEERLNVMELLWASFANKDAEINSPNWHEKVVANRREQIQSGKAKYISLESLRR